MRRAQVLLIILMLFFFLGPAWANDPVMVPHPPAKSVKLKVIESLGVDKLNDNDLQDITSPMGDVVFDKIFKGDEVSKKTMDTLEFLLSMSRQRGQTEENRPLCFMPKPPGDSQPHLYEMVLLWMTMGDMSPEKLQLYVINGTPPIGYDYYSAENPMRYWIMPTGTYSFGWLADSGGQSVYNGYMYQSWPDPDYPRLLIGRGPIAAWIEGDYYATGRWAQVSFKLLVVLYGEGRVHADSPGCYKAGMMPAHPTTWIDVLPTQ